MFTELHRIIEISRYRYDKLYVELNGLIEIRGSFSILFLFLFFFRNYLDLLELSESKSFTKYREKKKMLSVKIIPELIENFRRG